MLKVDPTSEITIAAPAGALKVEEWFASITAASIEGSTDGTEFMIDLTVEGEPAEETHRRFLDHTNGSPDTGPGSLHCRCPMPGAHESRSERALGAGW
jgi:hypothetical protein